MLGALNKLKVLTLKEEGKIGIGKGRGRTFKRYSTLHNFHRSNPAEWSLKPTGHLELKNPALLNQELVMDVSF